MVQQLSRESALNENFQTKTLRVSIKRSIHNIDPKLWDSVTRAQGLFHTHRFFATIESSGVAEADYWYLMCFDGEKLVATAVLAAFEVNLDLLMPRGIQALCRHIRRLHSSFLRIRVLFCGVPISIGKHTVSLSKAADPQSVYNAIGTQMEQIASNHKINFLCFKEFSKDAGAISLLNMGYLGCNSIPSMRLPITWSSYGEYIHSLRYSCRRQIRSSLRRLGISDSKNPLIYEKAAAHHFPRLVVRSTAPAIAVRMNTLYQSVMEHVETRLELLNPEFFQLLGQHMRDEVVYLCLEDDTGMQGIAMLARNGPRLHFLLVGFDYDCRDQYHTYFNLLNGIIAYGIQKRFDDIDLGQTTYQAKQRFGAVAEPMTFYLKSRSEGLHRILAIFKNILFPRRSIPARKVFRTQENSTQ